MLADRGEEVPHILGDLSPALHVLRSSTDLVRRVKVVLPGERADRVRVRIVVRRSADRSWLARIRLFGGFPVISPANAELALSPVNTTAHNAAASNRFLLIFPLSLLDASSAADLYHCDVGRQRSPRPDPEGGYAPAMPRKVMLIGLDCAEPSLVLERWRDELPTISGLMERGSYGRLTSVIPPITVPAWSCMMSSKTPGDLGVYGFRNRSDHTYDGGFIAMSTAIKEPRLWDYVTRAGGSSIVLSVPGCYPPRPLNGVMVGCFLTPSLESKYTYPAALKDEIAEVVGEYLFDTKDFRTEDKEYLLRQVYEMTDRRFELAEHLLETKPWTLFAMVEMGPDRMHHGFWKYMDAEHRKHEPGNAYESAILDYHRHVDGLIGKLLEHADDDTVVFVLSDHGAKRLDGGIRINEWLRREGLLATVAEPNGVTSLRDVGVDWSRTTAWGEGGYYARVFLNVAGREPEGTIPPEEYEAVRDDLARRIAEIPDDAGNPIPTAVYKPEDLYADPQGVAPDLIVVFGDLYWRSVGTIGGDEGIQTLENDTGPDDANHAQDGLYVVAGPGVEATGRHDANLLDIAPTVLEILGIEVPAGMRGTSLGRDLSAARGA